MAQDSRGGGYDLARDKEAKKALGTQTQQNIGAMANARQIGANTAAPQSIGELMTPSTFGREGPPVNEADLQARTQRNEGFLSDPNTQAMLMQFGVKMLSGGNPGDAIRSAMQMPARMAAANAKAESAGLDITNKKLDIAKKIKDLNAGTEKTPTELMKLLTEAQAEEAAGNHENASMLRSRAYQMSQEFSLTSGQILKPPTSVGGNAGDATNGLPAIENIPGGKADLEKQTAMDAVGAAKMKSIQDGMLVGASIDDINKIINSSVAPDFTITGGIGNALKWVPWLGQNAANVDALLQTVKARAGFTQLQEMRDASKTGGALGQVSDFENRLLAATMASLEQQQTSEQLQHNLATIKFIFDPNYVDARGQLSKALADKKITIDEATNQFNKMYRDAVFGPDNTAKGPTIDMATPPSYISDKMKEVWGVLTPDEKVGLLNDEDKAKMKGP